MDPDGDLLVKASDGAVFKVFKGFLIVGSSFFRDMFKNVRPATNEPDETVLWDEQAAIITWLLYQLYHISKPEINSPEELIRLTEAADKWGMETVLDSAKCQLVKSHFFDQNPFAVLISTGYSSGVRRSQAGSGAQAGRVARSTRTLAPVRHGKYFRHRAGWPVRSPRKASGCSSSGDSETLETMAELPSS